MSEIHRSSGSPRAGSIASGLSRAARLVVLAIVCLVVPGEGGFPAPQGGPTARDLASEGRAALDRDRPVEALDLLSRARAAVGEDPIPDRQLIDHLALTLYNLGVRFNNEGDADRAGESFRQAALLARSEPRMRDATFRRQLMEAALAVSRFLISSGRAHVVAPTAEALHHLTESDHRVTLLLAESRLASGDPEGAREAYDRVARGDPDSPKAAAGLGRVATVMGDRLEAAPMRGGSPQDGRLVRAREEAVRWLAQARDRDPAAGRENELARALVDRSRAQARAGLARAARESLREAEEAHRRAVSRDPASPWWRIDLAMFLFGRRHYRETVDHLDQAIVLLETLEMESTGGAQGGARRSALEACRGNRATALYNLAVDALNRADFDAVAPLLAQACAAGGEWKAPCDALRDLVAARREAFERTVAAHEEALRTDPDRASSLMALGDLFANLGDWDRARSYYDRLVAIGSDVPGLADRVAAVSRPAEMKERRVTIPLPGGEVDLTHYDEAAESDLVDAVEASWLRVTASLGPEALSGSLGVTVWPTKRSFRENAGYRVGGLVKGNYGHGLISVYQTPSHTVLEWISVLTHEMTHHAVERLTRSAAPRWFSEGVARYVQGELAVIDRRETARRLASSDLPPIGSLDDFLERSWNDPKAYLDGIDAALLAVEEMAGNGGTESLRRLMIRIGSEARGPVDFAALAEAVIGRSVEEVDAGWRRAIARP